MVPPVQHLDIEMDELEAILERANLSAEDLAKLQALLETFVFMQNQIEMKGASIKRLRKLLFGSSTEKTTTVVGRGGETEKATEPATDESTRHPPRMMTAPIKLMTTKRSAPATGVTVLMIIPTPIGRSCLMSLCTPGTVVPSA